MKFPGEVKNIPGLQGNIFAELSNNLERLIKELRINNILLSAVLPSAPDIASIINVLGTATPIYENLSTGIVFIRVTNNDPAQPIFVGGSDVGVAAGEVILAQNTTVFDVGYGQRLFAICAVPPVQARVSQGFNFLRAIDDKLNRNG